MSAAWPGDTRVAFSLGHHDVPLHPFQLYFQHHFGYHAPMVVAESEKVRENRLRRMADRQGYRLSKSRRRDGDAIDFGLYALLDYETGGAVNPALAQRYVHSWTLDDVEEWLKTPWEK